jgi:hypothetical protein
MRGLPWVESDAKVLLVIVAAFVLSMLLLLGAAYFL